MPPQIPATLVLHLYHPPALAGSPAAARHPHQTRRFPLLRVLLAEREPLFAQPATNLPPAMTEMSGNAYVANILKQEGVEYLMCFPSNPLISEVAKVGIRPVAFRHERGAAMAADGYSRCMDRQKFGVVAVQAQAGTENILGGLAQAYADNVPILVMLGGLTLAQTAVRPNFSGVEKIRGFCKQIEMVYDIGDLADVMRRAMSALKNGTPGPVAVELTADVCSQMVPVEAQTYTPVPLTRSVPEAADIAAAAKALLEAEKPVIWAGAGVLASGGTEQLQELAELIATPVFTTMPGKSAIDERHPLALGAGCGTTTLPGARPSSCCPLSCSSRPPTPARLSGMCRRQSSSGLRKLADSGCLHSVPLAERERRDDCPGRLPHAHPLRPAPPGPAQEQVQDPQLRQRRRHQQGRDRR